MNQLRSNEKLSLVSGLKDRNKPAQGNALGIRLIEDKALKGRHNCQKFSPTVLSRPFRAFAKCEPVNPGRRFALPWAVILRPFGADVSHPFACFAGKPLSKNVNST